MTASSAVHHTQHSQQNHKRHRNNIANTAELTSYVDHYLQSISDDPPCNNVNSTHHNLPHQHASHMQRNNNNNQTTTLANNSPTNNTSDTPYNANPVMEPTNNPTTQGDYNPNNTHTDHLYDKSPNISQHIQAEASPAETLYDINTQGKYFHNSTDTPTTTPSIHNHMEDDSPRSPHSSKQAPKEPSTPQQVRNSAPIAHHKGQETRNEDARTAPLADHQTQESQQNRRLNEPHTANTAAPESTHPITDKYPESPPQHTSPPPKHSSSLDNHSISPCLTPPHANHPASPIELTPHLPTNPRNPIPSPPLAQPNPPPSPNPSTRINSPSLLPQPHPTPKRTQLTPTENPSTTDTHIANTTRTTSYPPPPEPIDTATTRPTSPNDSTYRTPSLPTPLPPQTPTPSHHNPYLRALCATLTNHYLQSIVFHMITWSNHVLKAHHASLVSTLIEHFHPLERTNAWVAATRSISQSLFPALWTTDTFHGTILHTIASHYLYDTQWPQYIPLDLILSQPSPTASLALSITMFTQRITHPSPP